MIRTRFKRETLQLASLMCHVPNMNWDTENVTENAIAGSSKRTFGRISDLGFQIDAFPKSCVQSYLQVVHFLP